MQVKGVYFRSRFSKVNSACSLILSIFISVYIIEGQQLWGPSVDVDNRPVMQKMMDFNEHITDYRESWLHDT